MYAIYSKTESPYDLPNPSGTLETPSISIVATNDIVKEMLKATKAKQQNVNKSTTLFTYTLIRQNHNLIF